MSLGPLGSGAGTHLHLKGSKPEAATAGWGLFLAWPIALRVTELGRSARIGCGVSRQPRGVTDEDCMQIAGRREHGVLLRLHAGVYAVGHRALTVEGRWMGAVLACGPGAVLSHRTAGQLWGIVPRSGLTPEVTRPASFRERPGIRAHQAVLPPDEVEVEAGIPVTSVARTLFDLAAGFSDRQLERAMNEARVRGLTSRVSLPQLLERYPRRRGARKLRALLGSRRPGGITRNDFEELFVRRSSTAAAAAERDALDPGAVLRARLRLGRAAAVAGARWAGSAWNRAGLRERPGT